MPHTRSGVSHRMGGPDIEAPTDDAVWGAGCRKRRCLRSTDVEPPLHDSFLRTFTIVKSFTRFPNIAFIAVFRHYVTRIWHL